MADPKAEFSTPKRTKRIVNVSIIGTAGRLGLDKQLNKPIFEKMVTKARQIILDDFKLDTDCVELVSGGAAWSDHVAVRLFLQKDFNGLTLHFPTRWNAATKRFEQQVGKNTSGASANGYHTIFSDAMGIQTWDELQQAIDQGAKVVDSYGGFFDRNSAVAQCDYMIAFTLDDGNAPKKGSGTFNTWSQCKILPWHKKHVCISDL